MRGAWAEGLSVALFEAERVAEANGNADLRDRLKHFRSSLSLHAGAGPRNRNRPAVNDDVTFRDHDAAARSLDAGSGSGSGTSGSKQDGECESQHEKPPFLMLRKVHDPGRLGGYRIEEIEVVPYDYQANVKHVAEQTHLFATELYKRRAHKWPRRFPAEPTTLELLEHTNTMLALILDKA